jgi:hypothetical protein
MKLPLSGRHAREVSPAQGRSYAEGTTQVSFAAAQL